MKSPKTIVALGLFVIGGGGRIRTIEAIRSRFTVCPLWPLGNSPRYSILPAPFGAGRRTRSIKVRLGLALAGNARPRCI